jgi:glycosyltransferase 2 family protein
MDKKRILASVVVFLILASLFYLQYRQWRTFDWATFRTQTGRVSGRHVLGGIALIYIAYVMRAFRWKIFLRPVRPQVTVASLVSPTLVGFTGVALLGRAGEFIRPYLIARRTDLPVSSQLAVWGVERLFDFGGFTLLVMLWLFRTSAFASIPNREYYGWFREAAFLLTGVVAAGTVIAAVIRRNGERVASWLGKKLSHLPAGFAHRVEEKVREFGTGLNTIHDLPSLAGLILLSVGMWALIVLSYWEITHAYGDAKLAIPYPQLLILVLASMIGSLLQLPAVGGGSQLATIAVLSKAFGVSPELAASCGILLWLVGFASVTPAGFVLAHRERLSLHKLSVESHQAGETAQA